MTTTARTGVMDRPGRSLPQEFGAVPIEGLRRVVRRQSGTSVPTGNRPGITIQTLLIDLDDTLCQTNHRHHLAVQARELDGDRGANSELWHAYSLACIDDPPIEWTIDIVRAAGATKDIHLITGRQEIARDLTYEWLQNNPYKPVPFNQLTMRAEGDHRSNAKFKRETAQTLLARGVEIGWAMDDNAQAAVEYGRLGISTLIVDRPGKAWSGTAP